MGSGRREGEGFFIKDKKNMVVGGTKILGQNISFSNN